MKNYKEGKYIYYCHSHKRAIYKHDVYIIIDEFNYEYICENIGRTYLFKSTIIKYRQRIKICKWELKYV